MADLAMGIEITVAAVQRAMLGIGLAVPGIVADGTIMRSPNLSAFIVTMPGRPIGVRLPNPRVVGLVADEHGPSPLWPEPVAGAAMADATNICDLRVVVLCGFLAEIAD